MIISIRIHKRTIKIHIIYQKSYLPKEFITKYIMTMIIKIQNKSNTNYTQINTIHKSKFNILVKLLLLLVINLFTYSN